MANEKQSILVQSQLPEFITQDHPTFLAFVEAYYEWLEIENKLDSDRSVDKLFEVIGNPSAIINNALDFRDIDDTLDQFVQYFRNEIIPISLDNAEISQRELIKHIKQLYLSKGSPKSYKFLFRILYNDSIDTYFPIDFVMEASEGTFTSVHTIRITIPNHDVAEIAEFDFNNSILTKTDATTLEQTSILAITVKPAEGNTQIYEFIVDPIFVSTEGGAYLPDEEVTITQFDSLKELTGEVISRIASITPGSGGSGFRVGDKVRLLNSDSDASAVVEVGTIKSGSVEELVITRAGRGFTVGDVLYFTAQNADGGTGSGGSVQVTSVNANGIITSIDNQAVVEANIFNPVRVSVSTGGAGYTEFPLVTTSSVNGILLEASTASSTIGSVNTYQIIDAGAFYSSFVVENSVVVTIPDTNISEGTAVQFQYFTPSVDSDSDSIAFWSSLPYGGRIDSKSSANLQYTVLPVDGVNGLDSDGSVVELQAFAESNIESDVIYRLVSVIPSSGAIITIYSSPITIFEFDSNFTVNTAGSSTTEKAYQSEDGFLNSNSGGILRDNLLYHEYSYVIETEQAITKWRDIVKTLLHPAGTILFGEFNIVVQESETPISFISVAEAFDNETEFNETSKLYNYVWPNRTIDNVKIFDETNSGHTETHIDLDLYYSKYNNDENYIGRITSLDSDGIYVIRDGIKDVNDSEVEIYVEARESDSIYHWRNEYTKHSVDLNESEIVVTTFDGDILTDVRFPYGNTPVRYKLFDSDIFKTTIFAPVNDSDSDLNPDYDRYDSDNRPAIDERVTSFNPDADFEPIRGTISFDTDFSHFSETYTDAIRSDNIDHAANPLSDEQGEDITADNYPTRVSLAETAFNGDSFWDYEAKIATQYGGFNNKAFDRTKTYNIGDRVIYQGIKFEAVDVDSDLPLGNNHWNSVSPFTNKNDSENTFTVDNIAEFDRDINYAESDYIVWRGVVYIAANDTNTITDSDIYFIESDWVINTNITAEEVDSFRRTTTKRDTTNEEKPFQGTTLFVRYNEDSDVLGGKKDNWYSDYDVNEYQVSGAIYDPINEGHYTVLSVEYKDEINWLRFDDSKGTYSSLEYPIETITNSNGDEVDVQTIITGPFRGHELREEYEKELRDALKMDGTLTYVSDGITYTDQDAWERKWQIYTNRSDTLGYAKWETYWVERQNAEGYEKKNIELEYMLDKASFRGLVTNYNRTVDSEPGIVVFKDLDGNIVRTEER